MFTCLIYKIQKLSKSYKLKKKTVKFNQKYLIKNVKTNINGNPRSKFNLGDFFLFVKLIMLKIL